MGESDKKFQHRKPICFGCQQPGPYRRDCPKVKRVLSHKVEVANENAENLELIVTFAASVNRSQPETWLVDSEASSNIT